jgi:pyridoxal 5'-phosphate synthase pdxT subunit
MPGDGRNTEEPMKIGVLALQGAFREHREVLQDLGVQSVEIRLAEDLRGCDGLVLPGGETTTQRKLAQAYGLWNALARLAQQGIPILATCAGLILLARRIDGQTGSSLAVLDVDVRRNAYGRQVFSFETDLCVPCLSDASHGTKPFRAIFIRAPRIVRVGEGVSVLAAHQDEPVAVEEGNAIGLAFHPELTPDSRFHRYFLEVVRRHRASPTGLRKDARRTRPMQAAVGNDG